MIDFEKQLVPFDVSNLFNTLFIDYIEKSPNLASFCSYAPQIESFEKIIKEQSFDYLDRELLVKSLLAQNKAYLENYKLIEQNIVSLKEKNCYTVCTGHQLCVFTGPLYVLYKIISTISLAKVLNQKYPSNTFVPVYWMATEDHDFEEINHIHLFGKRLEWDKDLALGKNKTAAGKIATKTLLSLLEEIKKVVGEEDQAKELMSIFIDSYSKNDLLSDANRCLITQLFGDYGLVVIDANETELKSQLKDIIKTDIQENINFKLVNESIELLHQKGYSAQVNPREINFFYIDKNGNRERIEQIDSKFKVQHSSFFENIEEVKMDIDRNIGSYSPNVVLRPLYQQKILPNVAYVGGPGEIAYWLEYKKMFDFHKIVFPILIPRNSALLIDGKTQEQLNKYNWSILSLFEDTEMLVKKYIHQNASHAVSLEEETDRLKLIFGDIRNKAEKQDKTLAGAVDAELQKTINSLVSLQNKLIRAEKLKQEVSVAQIRKLKDKFFPANNMQERYDNFIPYYLKYGHSFISQLIELFNPLDLKLYLFLEKKQSK